jgi:hypothetical protein
MAHLRGMRTAEQPDRRALGRCLHRGEPLMVLPILSLEALWASFGLEAPIQPGEAFDEEHEGSQKDFLPGRVSPRSGRRVVLCCAWLKLLLLSKPLMMTHGG